MNKDLEQKLYKKYPALFQNVEKPTSESCMAFGCEIDDGWYCLLDTLCERIESYIKWQHDRVDIWDRIEYNRNFIPKKESEVDRPADAKRKIPPVVFNQVKEKFGCLTVYYSGGDDYIGVVVEIYSNLSDHICEVCGRFDTTVGHTTKWIKTLCEECSKNPIYEDRDWTIK